MSDLVERLRDRNAVVMSGLFHAIPAMKEAADEIEKLRAEHDGCFEMLWKWFEDGQRVGTAGMRPERIDGLSADDFKTMLDEHEAALVAEIEKIRNQLVKTREALELLWKETVASGNSGANDYGWPKARQATLAALSHPDEQGNLK